MQIGISHEPNHENLVDFLGLAVQRNLGRNYELLRDIASSSARLSEVVQAMVEEGPDNVLPPHNIANAAEQIGKMAREIEGLPVARGDLYVMARRVDKNEYQAALDKYSYYIRDGINLSISDS